MVKDPVVTDLGPFPAPLSPARKQFSQDMQGQRKALILWWLDRMVLSNTPVVEKVSWFWHGHWATSLGKVEYALSMFMQNQTLRKFSFGNFSDMTKAMVQDPALLYWLDANTNNVKSPNENLARELMELFTLGVNNYTQQDVTQVAKALTGWSVNRHSSTVSFNPRRHDNSSLSILGSQGSYDALGIAQFLVSQKTCSTYIPTRAWFRFISGETQVPSQVISAFNNRDNSQLFQSLMSQDVLSDPLNSQVKSPVEWFVATCKALSITPSQIPNSNQVLLLLNALGQLPFNPPNVGGWPHDVAWLSAASFQYRISALQFLLNAGTLPQFDSSIAHSDQIADWLGVYEFGQQSAQAINAAGSMKEAASIALVSPEFAVSA
jgi:uncharacterized protein (DUF1800 family)